MRRMFSLLEVRISYRYLNVIVRAFLLSFLLAPIILSAQAPETTTDSVIWNYQPDSADEANEYTEDEVEESIPDSNYFTVKEVNGTGIGTVRLRRIPDSVISQMKLDAAFWYANMDPLPQRGSGPPPKRKIGLSGQAWFQTILWIFILVGFAAFMVIYLSNSNVRLFRRKNDNIEEEEEGVATDDIFAINYKREIEKASAAGNHRLAIRLMFLRLLKNLSEKNIIQYQHDRTNFDYLVQLKETRYYNDFFRITRNYEYSWYGQFEVSREAYQLIKSDFENFDPILK